jgi:hypothetical protein
LPSAAAKPGTRPNKPLVSLRHVGVSEAEVSWVQVLAFFALRGC